MPDKGRLRELVSQCAREVQSRPVRLIVVGDMILDTSIEAVPGGRHPETGVPILRDAVSMESIGGAANIALALSRLGVEVILFGLVGSDLPGRQLMDLVERQPFESHLVLRRGWPTPRKDWIYCRTGESVQLVQRIDYDRPPEPAAREELLNEFRAHCPEKVPVVILADHHLGAIGRESLPILELARQRGAQVIAIPRSLVLRDQPLDGIVLNTHEMRRLADAGENADPCQLAAEYAYRRRVHVVLTMFEEGLFVCRAGQREGVRIPAFPLEHPDWMGTRDMTTAIVGLGLALGYDIVHSAEIANVFRHLVARQRGNGKVLWRDIFRFVGLEGLATG